jgi:hypothetical protein
VVFRERYTPWILVVGTIASAVVSWFLRSPAAGTILGVFIIIALIPLASLKAGLQVGALVGGMVGAISEAVLFSPERGVARTFIATGYGALLGASWGVAVALGRRVLQRIADRRATPATRSPWSGNDH